LDTVPTNREEVVDLKDFTFFVHLCNGEVVEVAPATRLRLIGQETVIFLGDIVMARFPTADVYFAARDRIAPPVMF
jgi:hypothetical protein